MKSLQALFKYDFPVGENHHPDLSGAEHLGNPTEGSNAVDQYRLAHRPQIQMPKPPFDAPLVKLRLASFLSSAQRKFSVHQPKFKVDVEIMQQRLSNFSLRFLKSQQLTPSEHIPENQEMSVTSSLSQSMYYDEYKLYSEHQRAVVRHVPIELTRYLDRHRLYEVLNDVFSQQDGLSEYVYVNGRNTAQGGWGYVQIGVDKRGDQLCLVIKSNLGPWFHETIERELKIALYEMNTNLTRSVHRDSDEIEETLEMSEEI